MTMEHVENMGDIWNRNPVALLGHLHLRGHGSRTNAGSESGIESEGAVVGRYQQYGLSYK